MDALIPVALSLLGAPLVLYSYCIKLSLITSTHSQPLLFQSQLQQTLVMMDLSIVLTVPYTLSLYLAQLHLYHRCWIFSYIRFVRNPQIVLPPLYYFWQNNGEFTLVKVCSCADSLLSTHTHEITAV